MKDETVKVIEIWYPVKEGGEIRSQDGKNLKLAAVVCNGEVVWLADKHMCEIIRMNPEEAKRKFSHPDNIN